MRMVRLTTCADGFEARILAARLGSEGIVWSLRGGQDGPFALGAVDLLVEADDLDLARELLVPSADDDEPLAPAPSGAPTSTLRHVLLVTLALVVVALFALARMGSSV